MSAAERRTPQALARSLSERAPATRDVLVAGLAGGAAMVPLGAAIKLAGYDVNVYGELTVETLLGSAPGWALLLEHIMISLSLAVPLVLLVEGRRRLPAVSLGVLYGGAAWLVLNSLLLPAVYSRPTPWALGWDSIWPSLSIHLLYGGVAAVALLAFGEGAATARREPLASEAPS